MAAGFLAGTSGSPHLLEEEPERRSVFTLYRMRARNLGSGTYVPAGQAAGPVRPGIAALTGWSRQAYRRIDSSKELPAIQSRKRGSEMPGIVVGVDGSAHSERALDWAMREAAIRSAP